MPRVLRAAGGEGPRVRPVEALVSIALACGPVAAVEVWGIEIILTGNADEGEERIPARIGERRPHPMGGRRIGKRAHRPVGGEPFARRVGKNRREPDEPRLLVDFGRLHGSDLVPAQSLTYDVEPT